jgi:hypothetical protein
MTQVYRSRFHQHDSAIVVRYNRTCEQFTMAFIKWLTVFLVGNSFESQSISGTSCSGQLYGSAFGPDSRCTAIHTVLSTLEA